MHKALCDGTKNISRWKVWRNWRNSACLHKLIFWDLNSYESLLCVQRQSRLTTTAINLTGCDDDDDGLQAQQACKVSVASYQVLPHQEETPHIKVQLWSSHMGIRHPNEYKKLNISCMQPGCRQPACQLDVGGYPLIIFWITSQPPTMLEKVKGVRNAYNRSQYRMNWISISFVR
jgi:hypothetical protein